MAGGGALPVVAIGELLWDMLPNGARLGGTTANFAVMTSRLGDDAALVSAVGDDELGRAAQEQIRALAGDHGAAQRGLLDVSFVQVDEELRTGTVGVTLDGQGRPKYVIHAPVAWDGIEFSSSLHGLAASAGAVCFGTLAQRGPVSRATIRGFVEGVGETCVRVCDLNLRAPFASSEVLHWCVSHSDVLKISDEELPEAALLLGLRNVAPLRTEDEEDRTRLAVAAAQAVLELAPGCKLVAVTLGPHGSVLCTRDASFRHEGFPTKLVDTVGAGDAFTAGLVHAYRRGAGLEAISHVANLCGSYVAGNAGANPPLTAALLEQIATAMRGELLDVATA